jgi:hypothetical protein
MGAQVGPRSARHTLARGVGQSPRRSANARSELWWARCARGATPARSRLPINRAIHWR